MIIYPGSSLPMISSDLPESRSGKSVAFVLVLLRMGFTYAPPVTRRAVVSYTALPTLPGMLPAVHFCCTILGVTSTGRYPASCPMKPGLSSSAPFRLCSRDHLSYLVMIPLSGFYTSKQLPPTNSLHRELFGSPSLLIPRKYSRNFNSRFAS